MSTIYLQVNHWRSSCSVAHIFGYPFNSWVHSFNGVSQSGTYICQPVVMLISLGTNHANYWFLNTYRLPCWTNSPGRVITDITNQDHLPLSTLNSINPILLSASTSHPSAIPNLHAHSAASHSPKPQSHPPHAQTQSAYATTPVHLPKSSSPAYSENLNPWSDAQTLQEQSDLDTL